jgi:5-bromo-4-chloroindolyl phosphate hydrolysis protein
MIQGGACSHKKARCQTNESLKTISRRFQGVIRKNPENRYSAAGFAYN